MGAKKTVTKKKKETAEREIILSVNDFNELMDAEYEFGKDAGKKSDDELIKFIEDRINHEFASRSILTADEVTRAAEIGTRNEINTLLSQRIAEENKARKETADNIYATMGPLIDKAARVISGGTVPAQAAMWKDAGRREVNFQIAHLSGRIHRQRAQIIQLEEKLAAMKTWRGIFRTIGQSLGLCR